MDALEALTQRHSTRRYNGKPVPKDVLETIVETGRLAATGRNVQPWEFVVVTDAAMRQKLADLAEFGKFIAEAGACVAVLCHDTTYYLEDGSAATQNIMVAATALGVQSCWVAGDKKDYADQVRRLLGAPDDCKLVSLIALGYEAANKPRAAKRSLADVLHWDKY